MSRTILKEASPPCGKTIGCPKPDIMKITKWTNEDVLMAFEIVKLQSGILISITIFQKEWCFYMKRGGEKE